MKALFLLSSGAMERRSFVGLMGSLGLAPAGLASQGSARGKTRFYLMEIYDMRQGTQPARFSEFFSKGALPVLAKLHGGPKIVLEGQIVPHTPQNIVIIGFQSLEQLWEVRAKLNESQEYRKAFETWQSGSEPPFEQQTNVLLEATDYSPEVEPLAPPPATPRLFDLRVYHSPNYRTLAALHERFAGPEIRIFHRVGVHPILYTSTVIGPGMPNLTYLIPFPDLATREKAWNAFGADPEWAKVRQESIDKHGQLNVYNEISIYRAAAYSPIR